MTQADTSAVYKCWYIFVLNGTQLGSFSCLFFSFAARVDSLAQMFANFVIELSTVEVASF